MNRFPIWRDQRRNLSPKRQARERDPYDTFKTICGIAGCELHADRTRDPEFEKINIKKDTANENDSSRVVAELSM